MQRLRVLRGLLLLALLAGGIAGPAAQEAIEKITPGQRVPALRVEVLRPGRSDVQPLNLGSLVGHRPVVVAYFRLGEAVGEEQFLEVQELVETELKGRVELLGAMLLGRKSTLEKAADRFSLFGVTVPVILEKQFRIGRALGVTTSPSISLIGADGVLRIADAKSLKQKVSSGMTLEQAIRSAARGGPVPTVMRLRRYYPANELVGRSFPDFMLKRFEDKERVRLSDHVGQEKKVTAVFFWHPNCKHCKKALPGIMVGYNSYRKWLDVVSVVDLKNQDEARNCRDTIRAHKIDFPVLEDEGRRVTDLYKVISTPTMFFIRPDGIIDSVYTSGEINYVPVFSSRIRSILKVGREYSGGP
ncbi:MAG: redoxin domain-containing protein [Acidobacteriota bacterium]